LADNLYRLEKLLAQYWTPVQRAVSFLIMETEARFDRTGTVTVLRALLRLARGRLPADREQLLLRTGGTITSLRTALRSLEGAGMVERLGDDSARLTMAGFAVAVAAAAHARKKSRAVVSRLRIPKRVVRKRAA
jgi:DNA-binding transcriptional ArsR family regulator